MGEKIDKLILEIIELVFFAANLPKGEKFDVLQKANLKVDLVKILIRLAMEVRALDNKKYIQLQKELQEIGKMIGGWLRSTKTY